jgi:diketogulonate reductase-like aldo/keto reductase
VGDDVFQHNGSDSDDVVREVVRIAGEIGCTPAQVAIAWLRGRPGVIIPIIGATKESQLHDNLKTVTLDDEHVKRLNAVSAIELGFPHSLLRQPHVTEITYGDQWRLVDDRRSSVRRAVNDDEY